MKSTGATKVSRMRRRRKNSPQGSTSDRVEPQRTHKNGR
jgi:hypothetical protein